MDACDVLIVGGGPAGSTCAWKLVQAGLDVLVLDKAVFPRDKVCGGWITPAVVEELEIDVADYQAGRVIQPITGFRTGLIGGSEVETHYGRPVSYGIRRRELDHYLLERSGARLQLGEPFESLRPDGTGWVVNGSIRAPLVIGAGGHFCPVARQVAQPLDHPQPTVFAQEIEFEMSPAQVEACQVEGTVPELFFCDDLQGYGWCFRKGNFLNIGLGREGERSLSSHVENFCEVLKRKGRLPPGIPTRFHGHAYQLYRAAPRKANQQGILLIGDAAGLAYPQSGEGIRPAVESGLMAADVVVQAGGNYRRETLLDLQKQYTTRFGVPTTTDAISRLVPSALRRWLASQLMATHWFTRRYLLDRWFLHADQPPLPASIGKALQPNGIHC